MIVKYKYNYRSSGSSWVRAKNNIAKNDRYGIIFAIVRDETGKTECYDMDIEQIIDSVKYNYPEGFRFPIELKEVELIADLISNMWIEKQIIHNSKKYIIKSFPEFLENDFWCRANDLNLKNDPGEEDHQILKKYINKYAKIYFKYIIDNNQDFDLNIEEINKIYDPFM